METKCERARRPSWGKNENNGRKQEDQRGDVVEEEEGGGGEGRGADKRRG